MTSQPSDEAMRRLREAVERYDRPVTETWDERLARRLLTGQEIIAAARAVVEEGE